MALKIYEVAQDIFIKTLGINNNPTKMGAYSFSLEKGSQPQLSPLVTWLVKWIMSKYLGCCTV